MASRGRRQDQPINLARRYVSVFYTVADSRRLGSRCVSPTMLPRSLTTAAVAAPEIQPAPRVPIYLPAFTRARRTFDPRVVVSRRRFPVYWTSLTYLRPSPFLPSSYPPRQARGTPAARRFFPFALKQSDREARSLVSRRLCETFIVPLRSDR